MMSIVRYDAEDYFKWWWTTRYAAHADKEKSTTHDFFLKGIDWAAQGPSAELHEFLEWLERQERQNDKREHPPSQFALRVGNYGSIFNEYKWECDRTASMDERLKLFDVLCKVVSATLSAEQGKKHHGWVIVDDAGNFYSAKRCFQAPPSEALRFERYEDAENWKIFGMPDSGHIHVRKFHESELCNGPSPDRSLPKS
jgi:hypothetical protein